ncbi:MAG TPA: hypothetical protein VMG80_02250 [Solirubrobacteraceae bacterium]|nr:hypothetical protein [Solirubrobacteraceae bacterium]
MSERRPEHIFLFMQAELPWELGPPDGRYLLRSAANGKPERVIVLTTLGARQAGSSQGRLRRTGRRRREIPPEPEPEPVATTRATIVDAVPVAVERQARAWLSDVDPERDVPVAFAALNRLLHARRIAAADPYLREVSPSQALTIRAGFGDGEQVADGEWVHAVELPWSRVEVKLRRRGAALRPDERLARLLAVREQPLVCEELALRARLDLDQGRLVHAAIELDRALAAALGELADEQRADLPLRVSELKSLHRDVAAAAQAALGPGPAEKVAEDTVRHALERLEAALRARSAAG